MTDFKIKMAELAAKYNISHKRDIDWHNFVAEVEELTEEQPEKDCAELIESSRALYFDIGFCITELLRARREGNEQHECNALSRMEGLMNETQQQLSCIIDYLEKEKEPNYTKRNELFDHCVANCVPKVMQEVSDNVDKLRAISTPAEEDWFKVAEEWEKEDNK